MRLRSGGDIKPTAYKEKVISGMTSKLQSVIAVKLHILKAIQQTSITANLS